MPRARSVNKGLQIAKEGPFRPTVQGYTERRSSIAGVGGCRKERFKGQRNLLGACKKGGICIYYDDGGGCVAVLASGGMVL